MKRVFNQRRLPRLNPLFELSKSSSWQVSNYILFEGGKGVFIHPKIIALIDFPFDEEDHRFLEGKAFLIKNLKDVLGAYGSLRFGEQGAHFYPKEGPIDFRYYSAKRVLSNPNGKYGSHWATKEQEYDGVYFPAFNYKKLFEEVKSGEDSARRLVLEPGYVQLFSQAARNSRLRLSFKDRSSKGLSSVCYAKTADPSFFNAEAIITVTDFNQ